MARTTGPILAVGTITVANDLINDHLDPGTFVKVVVGTGITALAFGGAEKVVGNIAVVVAYTMLVAVLFVPLNPAVPAPVVSLEKYMGG